MKAFKTALFIALVSALSLGLVFVSSCGDDDDSGDDDSGDDDTGDDDTTSDDDDTTPDDDDTADEQDPDVLDTTELENTIDEVGPYTVETTATDNVAVDSVVLFFRVGAGELTQVAMTSSKDGLYQGLIPGQAGGSLVSYYVEAADAAGNKATDPPDAPTSLFSFEVLETVAEDFKTDDGTEECGWGISPGPDGTMLAKIIIPADYPSYLTEVSVDMEQSCNGNFDFEVFVYRDLSGGDPSDATLVWSSGSQTEGMEENYEFEWYVFDVRDALADTPLTGGDWIVSVTNHSGQMYLGGDTDFPTPDPNGWVFHRDTSEWEPMSDYLMSWEGTFMVRAKGYYIVD